MFSKPSSCSNLQDTRNLLYLYVHVPSVMGSYPGRKIERCSENRQAFNCPTDIGKGKRENVYNYLNKEFAVYACLICLVQDVEPVFLRKHKHPSFGYLEVSANSHYFRNYAAKRARTSQLQNMCGHAVRSRARSLHSIMTSPPLPLPSPTLLTAEGEKKTLIKLKGPANTDV